MSESKLVIVSVAVAAVITLLTGHVNSTPGQLLGSSWYGFPATWLRYLVVGPQYNPWVVSYSGLVVDLILWTVVVWLLLRGYYHNCPSKPAPSGRSRRSK